MSNPIGPDHLEAEANRRLLGKPGDNPLEALLRQSAQQWAFERQESTNRKFGWYDCIAKLNAMLGLFGDFDHTPTVEECQAIWNSLMKERGQDKAKLGAIERAAFKLHEGVERFTATNAELSDEMYILRLAIGYDRMSQLRAAAREKRK